MKIRTNVKAGHDGRKITTNHNEKLAGYNKVKSLTVKTGIKAGLNFTKIEYNHNEKLTNDNSRSIEQKKLVGKKLRLSKETVRILKDYDLKQVAGGGRPRTWSNDPLVC